MKKLLLFFMMTIFTGNLCFSMSEDNIPVKGETVLRELWQREVQAVVYSRAAKAVKSCRNFELADTKLKSPNGAFVKDNDGKVIYGEWNEEWFVNACGQTVSVPVAFKQKQYGHKYSRYNRLRYTVGDGEILN